MTPTYYINSGDPVGGYQYIAQGASTPERGDRIDVVDTTDHYLIEGVTVIGIDGRTGWAIVQIPLDNPEADWGIDARTRRLLPVCPIPCDATANTVAQWISRAPHHEPTDPGVELHMAQESLSCSLDPDAEVDAAQGYLSGRIDPKTIDLRKEQDDES